MKSLICIMGPTGSGKTQLSLDIAKKISAEIISVDSALVYRGMDIGTAKPDKTVLQQVTHHLIDICDPSESYSAAQFCLDATAVIEKIHAKGKTPLLVGGTMMYFNALLYGLNELPSSSQAVRTQLEEELKTSGLMHLYERLKIIDPTSANRINANDTQRIIRALEVYEISGKTLTEFWKLSKKQKIQYNVIQIAIAPQDRKLLHQRIEKRFEEMLAMGFLDEVRRLYERGDLNPDLPAIRAVGYRQAWQHLSGEISAEQFKEKSTAATRQLAKRQLTWLRSWQDLHWFDSEDKELLSKVLELI